MAIKAQLTQRIVNAFPPWADTRTDEQSLGFQLLNAIGGLVLDPLMQQVVRTGDNYFLGTSVLSDPDVFYQVRLPQSYEFTKSDGDETELLYEAPVVTGTAASINYSVSLAEDNDINGFWLNAVPSRLELGTTYSGAHLIASGFAVRSPLEPLTAEGLTHMANSLSVTMSGGTQFISIDEGQFSKCLIQIDGENRAGIYLTEEMPFIQNETKSTLNEFVSVSGIRVYGVEDPETTFIWVKSGNFNNDHRPVAYPFDHIDTGDQSPNFWGLGITETLGFSVMKRERYNAELMDLRMIGYDDISSYVDIELLNTAGSNIHALDLAVEPYSDRVWIVTSTHLYCYDSRLPYQDFSQLTEKQYNSMCRIEPSSYWVARGEDVELDYVWRRPVLGITKHRVWVQDPAGTKYTILNGAFTTYITTDDSWVYGEPYDRLLRSSDIFTLSQRGDYIFTLEICYTDGTTEIDQRIITVPSRTPLGEYDLTSIGAYRPIVGIDIDSEYKLWVLNDQNGKHEIIPHYDIMLIDYKNKIVYFREPYDSVRIY